MLWRDAAVNVANQPSKIASVPVGARFQPAFGLPGQLPEDTLVHILLRLGKQEPSHG